MIIDNIKNCEQYYSLHKDFKEAFEFLKSLTADSEPGSKEIGKLRGSVSHSSTTDFMANGEKKPFEAHKNYIDIHYIVEGEEYFGYSNIESLTVTKEYDEQGDYLLLGGEINKIKLQSGEFCITLPQDAHIPCMEYNGKQPIKRAIVKVKAAE